MSNYLPQILISLITNLISSFIFILLLLRVFSPRIIISKEIAKEVDQNGIVHYRFKVLNKSNFAGYDVHARLHAMYVEITEENCLHQNAKEVKLTLNHFSSIHPYCPQNKCLKNKYANHAMQLRTIDNIEDVLMVNNQSLVLQISLRHGLTGLSRQYDVVYTGLKKVKVGEFGYGNAMEIT